MHATDPDFLDAVTDLRDAVGGEQPAVERAAEVLDDHVAYLHYTGGFAPRGYHACGCGFTCETRGQHRRHVAEQLSAAGLLAP